VSNSILKAAKPAGLWPRCYPSALISSSSSFSFHRRFLLRAFALTAFVAGAALVLQQTCAAQSMNTEQAAQAQAFVNTAGVNTHLTYTDTPYYTAWPQIFNALQTLGVKHIRDGYFDTWATPQIAYEHQQLAQAGITTDYVLPFGMNPSPQALQQFAGRVWDVEAVEAPNECDILGDCGGGGIAGISNVISLLPNLQSAAQSLNVPLMGPSYVLPSSYPQSGNIAPLMALNSLHLYFGGRNPGSPGWGSCDAQGNCFGSFAYWLDQSNIDAPGVAPVNTETGYLSFPSTTTPYTVPEGVAATYDLRTLLLGFKYGFQETFFYQLLDDPSSPAGYGLLNSDLSPKAPFTALSNLLSLMSDPGGSFSPGTLTFALAGGDSNLQHMLFQKSDGSYYLVLWLEEPCYNPATNQNIAVAPENIGIELPGNYTTATDYQFNPSGNYVAFNQPMYGNWAGLTVTDQISVVKIVSR
jgi:hypothetical protein